MLIPGIVISALTFPGVIVHELAHQLFCRLMGIPVYEVKYFQLQNPNGYVIHEASEKPFTNVIISIGPFLLNTLLGILMLLPVSIEIMEFGMWDSLTAGGFDWAGILKAVPSLLAAWIGVSILMHAFPSTGDAEALIQSVLKNKKVKLPAKILVAPVIGFIYIGALGSVVWLDFFYAMGIGALLPTVIAKFL